MLAAMRGSDELELLRVHRAIGLVLLDLAMPDSDGMEVLRRVRQVNARVPVYLMTGFLPPKLDTTGASGVLSKPLDLTQLNELLASVAGV